VDPEGTVGIFGKHDDKCQLLSHNFDFEAARAILRQWGLQLLGQFPESDQFKVDLVEHLMEERREKLIQRMGNVNFRSLCG
jgi:hypothetical protein